MLLGNKFFFLIHNDIIKQEVNSKLVIINQVNYLGRENAWFQFHLQEFSDDYSQKVNLHAPIVI